MEPASGHIKLTREQARIKKNFEDTMLPHMGHTLIYKVKVGELAKGRLRRVSFDPSMGYNICYVWYDGKPFPIKSYFDMVIKCETCSQSKTIA